MGKWIAQLNSILWTVNGTGSAVPAFVGIPNCNFPFFLVIFQNIQRTDLGTGSASNAFFFINYWWHSSFLPSCLNEFLFLLNFFFIMNFYVCIIMLSYCYVKYALSISCHSHRLWMAHCLTFSLNLLIKCCASAINLV